MAINSFKSAPGVPLIQLQWNLSKGVMRRHLTRSHTHARRHVGCFCNASKDLKSEKATCKLILYQISGHLIHAFKLLPLGNEVFLYHFNTLHRLYWIWSLWAARMCSVDVCKTSWPHLKKSANPGWWVSGDRFSFQLSMPLSPVKTWCYQCQLELSLSLLLQASYSQIVPTGWREGGGEKSSSNRERKGAFFTWHNGWAVSAPHDAVGEFWKNEGESSGCLSPQRSQLYN